MPRRFIIIYMLGAGFWLIGTNVFLHQLTGDMLHFVRWQLLLDSMFLIGSAALFIWMSRSAHARHGAAESAQAPTLFAESQAVMLLIDPQSGAIIDANPAAVRFYGYAYERLRTMTITDMNTLPPNEVRQEMQAARTQERTFFRFRHRLANGMVRDVEVYSVPFKLGDRLLLHSIVHDVTERSGVEAHLSALIDSAMDAIVSINTDQEIVLFNPAAEQLFGCSRAEAIGQPLSRFLPANARSAHLRYVQHFIETGATRRHMGSLTAVTALRADGSAFPAEVSIATITAGDQRLATAILRDISERVQHEREREALINLATALRNAANQAEIVSICLDHLNAILTVEHTALILADPIDEVVELVHGHGLWTALLGLRFAAGSGVTGSVMSSREPMLFTDITTEPELLHREIFPPGVAAACIPLATKTQAIGALWVVRPNPFTEHERGLLLTIADMATNAIHRAALYAETVRRLRRIAALRAIDLAMISSNELQPALDRILIEVIAQLEVDVGAVLLRDPHQPLLHLVAQYGMQHLSKGKPQVQIGEGLAGRAALMRQRLAYHDQAGEPNLKLAAIAAEEGLVQGYAVPLLIADELIGVLNVFRRSYRPVDAEWLDFLDALAGQTAIAIHRATLIAQLQRANDELSAAYDATLAGWARALELRDEETGGHAQRVTKLTVQLAEALAIPPDQIAHMRRGALLHDIGKMGVPDAILHKPGPLTAEERREMERHPIYAQMWLAPIGFLQPALDIPFYHHERWDGSGYPQGLCGNAIPQAARIFAVVDVWDALTSNRPYRSAWTPDQARAYLAEHAGSLFDPEIVAVFLQLVARDEPSHSSDR